MRRLVLVSIIIAVYLLVGAGMLGNEYGKQLVRPVTEPKLPKEAVVFVNKSGVFVKVPLDFDDEMWVDGIVVIPSHGEWLVEAYEIHVVNDNMPEDFINFVVRDYSDKMIPVKKTLSRGVYVFNVTGYIEMVKAPYPVWRGKVVIGERTIPLSELGEITPVEEKVLNNWSTLIVNVYDTYVVDANPTILSGQPDFEALEKKAYRLFREGKRDELVGFVRAVLEDIVNGIRNGSIVVGYYGQPFSKEVANKYLDKGRLVVEVMFSTGDTVANATLTTENGYKYYLATKKSIEIRIDSKNMKPHIEYGEEEQLIPVLPEPDVADGAVIVFYRETPYSPYKILILPLKADNPLYNG